MLKKQSGIQMVSAKETDKSLNESLDKQFNNLYSDKKLLKQLWWVEKLEDYEEVPEYKVNKNKVGVRP